MSETAREKIIEVLNFGSYHTTPLFLELQSRGCSIGIKSVCNRLEEMQIKGEVIGEKVEGYKEKRWSICKYGKTGQGVLI